MTNFTLHKQLEDGKPPSADKARGTCRRYAYLSEKLSTGGLDDGTLRGFHQTVDAQMSQAADPSRPPVRTFWHAFYYPEERRVRLSYYLRDEPHPDDPRLVRPVRTDYAESRLEPTESTRGNGTTRPAAATSAPRTRSASTGVEQAILAAGGTLERARITAVGLDKATKLDELLPLLAQLPDLESLNLGNPALTDADVLALRGLACVRSVSRSRSSRDVS